MHNKDTGGPAFPVHGGHHPDDDPRNRVIGGGMTLRDWFAGQALAGLLAGYYRQTTNYNLSEAPEEAYKIADAMIAERQE